MEGPRYDVGVGAVLLQAFCGGIFGNGWFGMVTEQAA